jgi:hypothetical protein
MAEWLVAEEIQEYIIQLFHIGNTYEIEEWKSLTPIEFGVLSWHLGNFYCYQLE